MAKTILEDERAIKYIIINSTESECIEVGVSGFTKIEAYPEPGSHCYIAWIAVYKDNVITHRIPASMVQISYKTEKRKK